MGINQFLPNNKIIKLLAYDCELRIQKEICENVIFSICGFDKKEFNEVSHLGLKFNSIYSFYKWFKINYHIIVNWQLN